MSSLEEPVNYRRAEAADAMAITRLLMGIYGERQYFVGDGPAPQRNLALRIETDDPHRALYLVAVASDEVVGWLELHRPPAHRLEHVAVLTLAIAPRMRRRGVGTAMLHHGYRWCGEVGVVKVSLHVRAGNEAAIRLYEREGFEHEGRERGQIRLGAEGGPGERYEDNLIMGKWL